MPKVSVIIPVYKVEKWLPACLDSVLSQTLRDIEVICIDDASPDGCPAMLDEYAARDARIKVIHLPENHQQGYGRNRGMELATGEYLYFLDADDKITEEALETLCALMDGEALDGVFFDSQVVFESPALEKKHAYYRAARRGSYPDEACPGRALFEEFCRQGEWTCYIQRQLWRRSFIEACGIRFPEGTEHEDEWFPFAAILQAERVRYHPGRYFIRRYREDSVMTRPPSARDFHGYFRLYGLMTELVCRLGASRGTDIQLGRMLEKLTRLYPVFAREQNPEGWFRSEEERRAYSLFAQAQRASAYYEALCQRVMARFSPEEAVYLYGAGRVAQSVYRGLAGAGCVVQGFLVTRRSGNPTALFGHPVWTLDERSAQPGDRVIIAVSQGYRDEVEAQLKEKGWRFLYYDD